MAKKTFEAWGFQVVAVVHLPPVDGNVVVGMIHLAWRYLLFSHFVAQGAEGLGRSKQIPLESVNTCKYQKIERSPLGPKVPCVALGSARFL